MATNLQNLFLATVKSFNPSTLKSFDTASGVGETDLAKNPTTTVATYSDKTGANATTRGAIIGPFGSANGAFLPSTASNYSGIILDSTAAFNDTELADFSQNITIATWFANKTDQEYPKVILAISPNFAIRLKNENTLTLIADPFGIDGQDLNFDNISFNINEWNLVTIVFNASDSKIYVYVNDKLSDQNIVDGAAIAYSPSASVKIKKISLGAYPGLSIGNWPNPSHSGFTGMRSIAFASAAAWYGTALSTAQVQTIATLGANSNLVIAEAGTLPGTLDDNITVDGIITKTIDGDTIKLNVSAITDITAGTGISLDKTGTVVEISAVSILPEGMVKANTSDTAPDYLINKISVDSGLNLSITPAAVGPTANVFYAVNYTSLQAITTDVNDGDMAVVSAEITNTSNATVYARIDSQWVEQNYPTGSSIVGKLKYLSSSNWPPTNQPAAADYEYGAIALVSAEADLTAYLAGDKKGKLYVLINANAWNSTTGWREIIPPSASFVKLAIDYPTLISTVANSETFVNNAAKTKTVFNDKTPGFLKEKFADGSNINVTTEEIAVTSNARYSYNQFPPAADLSNYWLYGNILIVSNYATAAAFIAAATVPLIADLYILAHEPANQGIGPTASDWIKLTPDTGNKVCFAISVEALPVIDVPAGCFAVVAANLNNTQADIYQENDGNWQLYRDKSITTSTVVKFNIDNEGVIDIITLDPNIVRTANSLTTADQASDKVRSGKDTGRIADKHISLRTVNRAFTVTDQTAMLALANTPINDMIVSGDIAIIGDGSGIYIFNGIADEPNWQSSGYRRPYACNENTVIADWTKLIGNDVLFSDSDTSQESTTKSLGRLLDRNINLYTLNRVHEPVEDAIYRNSISAIGLVVAGDTVVQTDTNETYIFKEDSSSTITNWQGTGRKPPFKFGTNTVNDDWQVVTVPNTLADKTLTGTTLIDATLTGTTFGGEIASDGQLAVYDATGDGTWIPKTFDDASTGSTLRSDVDTLNDVQTAGNPTTAFAFTILPKEDTGTWGVDYANFFIGSSQYNNGTSVPPVLTGVTVISDALGDQLEFDEGTWIVSWQLSTNKEFFHGDDIYVFGIISGDATKFWHGGAYSGGGYQVWRQQYASNYWLAGGTMKIISVNSNKTKIKLVSGGTYPETDGTGSIFIVKVG